MRRVSLFAAVMIWVHITFAQHPTIAVGIGTGLIRVSHDDQTSNSITRTTCRSYSFSFRTYVSQQIGLQIDYEKAWSYADLILHNNLVHYYNESPSSGAHYRKGDIWERSHYKFIDFGLEYHQNHRKHVLSVQAGPALAFGTNMVIDRSENLPPYEDWIYYSHNEKAHYFGAHLQASYEYKLTKRISVIADLGGRVFGGGLSSSLNYGIRAAYRFYPLPKFR